MLPFPLSGPPIRLADLLAAALIALGVGGLMLVCDAAAYGLAAHRARAEPTLSAPASPPRADHPAQRLPPGAGRDARAALIQAGDRP